MIFSAYLGDKRGADAWLRALHAHAAWLGLEAWTGSEVLQADAVFSYAWLHPSTRPVTPRIDRSSEHLRLRTAGEGWSENAVSLDLAVPGGALEIAVPIATPEHFYAASRAGAHVVGNDLRLMVRWAGLDLDPRGVYATLRFNASLPPFTVSRSVVRIPWGHSARLSPGASELVQDTMRGDTLDPRRSGSVQSPAEELLQTIDRTLENVPRDSVLFFSGGVDSALLASRLAEIGRADVRLLNLAFGPSDPEADHARLVASRLGLVFDQVVQTDEGVTCLLERLARDYSFPFGDPSTIPTHVLARAALNAGAPPAVIEGTGADGAYGAGLKFGPWSSFYALPRQARGLLGAAYAGAGLWKSSGSASRLCRWARRSTALPLHVAAILGRDALDGIAYSVTRPVRDEVHGGIDGFVYAASEGFAPRERLSLFDVMAVCAERFATKSYDPLRHGGTPTIYPFLEPRMIRLSASLTWEQKCGRGGKKGLLKELLARSLPPEMVYRKKSGFDPPFARTFASRSVQGYLHDVVLAAGNPLRGFFESEKVREIVTRIGRGAPLDAGTYEFLWTLCATSGWLRSVREFATPDP